MRTSPKSDVYDYIVETGGATVAEIAQALSAPTREISGLCIRLRGEGKIRRIRGEKRADPHIWEPEPKYYAIEHVRKHRRKDDED